MLMRSPFQMNAIRISLRKKLAEDSIARCQHPAQKSKWDLSEGQQCASPANMSKPPKTGTKL